MKNKAFSDLLTLAALFLLMGLLSACSSSDAENIIEEVLPTTMVRAIHLSPDAPEVDIDFVVIETQASVVGLAYKEASPYTEVSTGVTKLVFKRSNGEELGTLLEQPLLASDVDNTVYAVNLAANLEFIQSEDDRLRDDVNAKVRLVHAAPDAPAVDVKTDTPDGTAVFSGATFKDVTEYTAVPPGAYTFVITPAGDTENTVVTFEPVTLDAGTIYTVVALGTLDEADAYDFGVRVFVDSGDGNTFVDLTIAQ